jgi:hypothetical protein
MPQLSWSEVRERAIRFSRTWTGATSERADKQTFWNEFFDVFGIRRASVAAFEANVRNLQGHTNAIDLLWRGTLIVEHKSRGQSLERAETQAFGYIEDLTREGRGDEIPRYVLVSDFGHFVLYDLEPEEQRDLPLFAGRPLSRLSFTLAEFPRHTRAFAFMLGQTRVRLDPEDPANQKAYDRMCQLHDALKAGGFSGHELERLLVRILFCMFAEDTGIFAPEAFTQFVRLHTRADGEDLGARLNELFEWLNRPEADNAQEDADPLYGFRYVNGGLFSERLGFARFNRDMRNALLASCEFSWARISPAVFGSLFQGVLDDRARRQQGAHYTSERDIMKVLRSLFLDDLLAEWERVKRDRSSRRRANIEAFHEKLRSLRFLDPACGCGNFLVLAYRELRGLEIEVMRDLHGAQQQVLDVRQLLKVDVDQFHGIEYSEWPVRIAEVALWLMDHQMNAQAAETFGQSFDRLPLRSSPHIVHGNALRVDWNAVLPREECSYVLGNPPFVGRPFRNEEQKADHDSITAGVFRNGDLDYVCNWFVMASSYVTQRTRVGFVATNSITQGVQAPGLWSKLLHQDGNHIHFAHRTFDWQSEARGKAAVDVVIVGFGRENPSKKLIWDYSGESGEPTCEEVPNISPYLTPGSDTVVFPSAQPLQSFVPEVVLGNQPTDGGHFILSPAERHALLATEPGAARFIRPCFGAEEFLNGSERYCLWLHDAEPEELRGMPEVMRRIEAVRQFRLASKKEATRRAASTPAWWQDVRYNRKPFILIPQVSSETRRFLPVGFLPKEVIPTNLVYIIPSGTIYDFGLLSSSMHASWVRLLAGRLESRIRWTPQLVYNSMAWPSPAPEQRERVEEKAQAVLAAREPHLPPHGMATLADLYDPNTMSRELVRAHAELDRAVERCYRAEPFRSDRERVEHLFRLYEQLTAPLLPVAPRRRGRAAAPAGSVAARRPRGRTAGLPAQGPGAG